MKKILVAFGLVAALASAVSVAMAHDSVNGFSGSETAAIALGQAADLVPAGPSSTDPITFPHPAERPAWEAGE